MIWNKGNQTISAGDNSTNVIAGGSVNIILKRNVSTELVDEKITELVELIRKTRFFTEFDHIGTSLKLCNRLVDGDLSEGSDKVRSFGLAWSARLLARSDHLDQAEEYLERAKNLGDSEEIKIAEAFLLSQKGDKTLALQSFSGLDLAASRSAALMIVSHHDGADGALKWMDDAGYGIDSLDSDGKSFLITQKLRLGSWDKAADAVDTLTDKDFEHTPILYHLSALATLVSTVPLEFRSVVLTHVPFELNSFPLASDAKSMESRRSARDRFIKAAGAAKDLKCFGAEKIDDEFALWLELRDPELVTYGKTRLESKLRDLSTALGFVHYAIRFGIKLDHEVIEREIDRNIAINGGMTMDAAVARFALAFAKPTAEEAANYIVRHQEQLSNHVDPKLMCFRQVELYSQAGLIDRANAVLEHLIKEGVSDHEEKNLRRIVSEAQGSDLVESRKAQYESTGELGDLINLVAELEEHHHWDDLSEYGKKLFEQTRAIKDAERLAHAFNNTYNSGPCK